jgi:hypothetical protein
VAGQVRDPDGGEQGQCAAVRLVRGGRTGGGHAPVRGVVRLRQPHARAAVGAPHRPHREGPRSVFCLPVISGFVQDATGGGTGAPSTVPPGQARSSSHHLESSPNRYKPRPFPPTCSLFCACTGIRLRLHHGHAQTFHCRW